MTVFRAATLRTFFFAFHAGAKELNVFGEEYINVISLLQYINVVSVYKVTVKTYTKIKSIMSHS